MFTAVEADKLSSRENAVTHADIEKKLREDRLLAKLKEAEARGMPAAEALAILKEAQRPRSG